MMPKRNTKKETFPTNFFNTVFGCTFNATNANIPVKIANTLCNGCKKKALKKADISDEKTISIKQVTSKRKNRINVALHFQL